VQAFVVFLIESFFGAWWVQPDAGNKFCSLVLRIQMLVSEPEDDCTIRPPIVDIYRTAPPALLVSLQCIAFSNLFADFYGRAIAAHMSSAACRIQFRNTGQLYG
jgi:hypothetical protein